MLFHNEAIQYAIGDLIFMEPEAQHGATYPTVFSANALRELGTFRPIGMTTTGYAVPMCPAIADGRVYFRLADGIQCFDLRDGPDDAVSGSGSHGGRSTNGGSPDVTVREGSMTVRARGAVTIRRLDGRTLLRCVPIDGVVEVPTVGLSTGVYVVRRADGMGNAALVTLTR